MAELRTRYGHTLPAESAGSEFHEIAPGHVRKRYSTSPARGCEVGLLVNFGHFPKIEFERLANTRKKGASAEEEQ